MRISDWSSDVCSSDLKKFGVKSGVQTQSGHCIINGQIETGDLPAEAPLEMHVQAFGEQPEARRQVVTSPVGIDRKSVVEGKSVSVRVDLGGRRIIKKKKTSIQSDKDKATETNH